MKKQHRIKAAADIVILLCSMVLCLAAYLAPWVPRWSAMVLAASVLCAALAASDLIRKGKRSGRAETGDPAQKNGSGANFCLDQWYVEDLGSQNGVKVRKAEDGECYKVMGRPCRVQAGDVLYIANTKLLLS